ncbi:MAG: YicC/YloC family endoribonuclease [Armatimonadota bacterium]|nr:YicC/YloC family endoribonuclease [Armatimonadota bacterium]
MTGFGAAAVSVPGGRLAVEMRSINHRFSEIQIRLPRELAGLEDRIRALVTARILRGRVEVSVTREDAGRRARVVRADVDLAAAYARALRDLAHAVGAAGEVTIDHLTALPDVIRVDEDRPALDAVWPPLEEAVRTALDALVAMRAAEGRRLADDVLARLEVLERAAETVAARSRVVVQAYRDRLRARLGELLGEVPVDEARIAMELAIVADRADITEELVRLRSHLAQFRETVLGEDGALGRKLEFLLQEMGREVNTLGAKANDLEITRQVIAMKAELESLREQVQNVE